MTPFSFEWQWNVEYLIFMGFLYLALTIVGAGLTYALVKSWLGLLGDEGEQSDSRAEIAYRSRYAQY
jgi:hypothetical protein